MQRKAKSKPKSAHGGERKNAGRKPGVGCKTCSILLRQLEDARLREGRLMRQIESQGEQIGTVISKQFETFHVSGPTPESSVAPGLPLEYLSDVTNVSDEEFVKAAEQAVLERAN